MKRIAGFLKKRANATVFSLIAGAAYFVLILGLIMSYDPRGWLIAAFFSPLVICGIALVLLKSILRWTEEGSDRSLVLVFWLHIAVFIVAAVFLADMVIR